MAKKIKRTFLWTYSRMLRAWSLILVAFMSLLGVKEAWGQMDAPKSPRKAAAFGQSKYGVFRGAYMTPETQKLQQAQMNLEQNDAEVRGLKQALNREIAELNDRRGAVSVEWARTEKEIQLILDRKVARDPASKPLFSKRNALQKELADLNTPRENRASLSRQKDEINNKLREMSVAFPFIDPELVKTRQRKSELTDKLRELDSERGKKEKAYQDKVYQKLSANDPELKKIIEGREPGNQKTGDKVPFPK
jgi:chromosome segregation ATPase